MTVTRSSVNLLRKTVPVRQIAAVFIGMGFFGISTPVAVGCAVALVVLSACGSRYSRWERLSMGLALFNLAFVAVAFLAHPSPGGIAASLLTWTPLPKGSAAEFLLILASNIGATVTPWMLFFQQSASVDKDLTPRDIKQGRLDTLLDAQASIRRTLPRRSPAAPCHGVCHRSRLSVSNSSKYATRQN